MVGRRGCAQVLAELIDARVLPNGVHSLFVDLMIDEATNWMSPQPLDETTPMPWRDPHHKDYPSEDWCSESTEAAESYASEFSENYVLAEKSTWRWLAWGVPEEDRWIRTRHGEQATSPLIAPAATSTWELTVDIGSRYPALRDLGWPHHELVVQGRGLYSDAERLEWLALHPAVAEELGWAPGDRQFEWVGADGSSRARTVLRVRGQLSHTPPSDAICAEVWQVVLSQKGWAELMARFSGLRRTVFVRRVLPENRREGRIRLSKAGKATIVDEQP
jgi:hypothetical protein